MVQKSYNSYDNLCKKGVNRKTGGSNRLQTLLEQMVIFLGRTQVWLIRF